MSVRGAANYLTKEMKQSWVSSAFMRALDVNEANIPFITAVEVSRTSYQPQASSRVPLRTIDNRPLLTRFEDLVEKKQGVPTIFCKNIAIQDAYETLMRLKKDHVFIVNNEGRKTAFAIDDVLRIHISGYQGSLEPVSLMPVKKQPHTELPAQPTLSNVLSGPVLVLR